MSLGPVMLDLAGVEITPQERELLKHPATGGVILFSRNFETIEQLHRLTREIHELREPRLLIAVDQEGGRVQRFRDGFTRLPPAAWFGRLYAANPAHGKRVAEKAGWLMAAELRSAGIDFSFAPVLDLGAGVSQVIGDRAFASRPGDVAELAHAWMMGAHRAGMAAVGKHFPGHGNVVEDSHHALPVDHRRFEDLIMDDILPFERMIHFGLEAIMPAHVLYDRVDAHPAGFSPYWLREILRGRLEFQGVIFSDDLSMAAADVLGDLPTRASAALEAGCDMVLVCNDTEGASRVLDALDGHDDPAAHVRLMRMHGRLRVEHAQMRLDPHWREAIDALAAFEESSSLSLVLGDPK